MLPNKVVSFPESIIWYFPDILEVVSQTEMTIESLWELFESKIQDINLFLSCIDALYALGKIKLCNESGMIEYVKAN